jgi:hypothetical protein
MSRRLSLAEGFERLLAHYAPDVAHHKLRKGLHEKPGLLYCDGRPLAPSYIEDEVRVLLLDREQDKREQNKREQDGPRYELRLMPKGPMGWERTDYTWELDAKGLEALLPLPKRRGRKSVQNWTGIVDGELRALWHKSSLLLEDFDALERHLSALVGQKTGSPPKYPKRLRQRIRRFLQGHN